MIHNEGKAKCVKNLLSPAEKVIKTYDSLMYQPFEKRKELWEKISENYEKFLDGECGTFLNDLSDAFQSKFEIGLLALTLIFRKKGETFEEMQKFTTLELESYEKLIKYNVLELLTVTDIKKKVVSKNPMMLELFKEYYLDMDSWADEIINNSEIKLPLRNGFKNIWTSHKKKLNQAVSELTTEFDWFGEMIISWKNETEQEMNKEFELEKKIIVQKNNEQMKEKDIEIETIKNDFSKKEQELKDVKSEFENRLSEIKKMKQNLENGSRFVDAGSAKQYEMNFIDRIERKFSNEVEISGKKFKMSAITPKSEKTIKINELNLNESDFKKLPENESLRIELIEKGLKIFGKKENFVFVPKYVSRIEKYSKYGFDTDPLTLDEINEYVFDVRCLAKSTDKKAIICISSPTGFENGVKKHIWSENFHNNFLSNFLSIFLLDLETGELIYNKNDDLANEFKKFAEIEIDVEKIEKVKLEISKRLENKTYVSVDELLNVEEEYIVKPAVYSFADEKGLKVQHIKGPGLTLFE